MNARHAGAVAIVLAIAGCTPAGDDSTAEGKVVAAPGPDRDSRLKPGAAVWIDAGIPDGAVTGLGTREVTGSPRLFLKHGEDVVVVKDEALDGGSERPVSVKASDGPYLIRRRDLRYEPPRPR